MGMQNPAQKNVPIGKLLLMNGLITVDQLEYALKIQKQKGKKLGDTLIELGYLQEKDLMKILSSRLKVPFVEIGKVTVKQEACNLLTRDYCEKHQVLPIDLTDKGIVVATTDPMNFFLADDIALKTNKKVRFVMATQEDIETHIPEYYSNEEAKEAQESINDEFQDISEMEDIAGLEEQLKSDIDNAPIVKFVNNVIETGVRSGASDIHIEPQKNVVRIRMRIDGQLVQKMEINSAAMSNLTTRIKIMSGMDIAEKRIPQDGRIETKVDGRTIDLRVSNLPTVYGEKIVIRVLGGIGTVLSVDQLGMSEKNLEFFKSIIKTPNGIILVCGPTGSGKSTTLYSVLAEVNDSTINTITVEDPVEYKLDGITQVQVNAKAGLTFAAGLRSILRQDPDIIMIGEIRDNETAQIAVKAAITGHVVLSTIHTNSAVGAVARLVDMDIEPYMVADSTVGVIAQRLVKKLCPHCKQKYTTPPDEMEYLGITEPMELYKAGGCKNCGNTGYKGRMGIHEIFVLTGKIRAMINKGVSADEIEEEAIKNGMVTLREDCLAHVFKGETSVEELIRATYSV
jgi:type IV pilus assembly protein PilB